VLEEKDEGDVVRCLLVYGNRGEGDILLRGEIAELMEGREERCKVIHVLSNPPEAWEGERGRVGKEMIGREVGVCGQRKGDEMVLVCGPEGMERSVKTILGDLGWRGEDVLFF